jgi:hypothetical protein
MKNTNPLYVIFSVLVIGALCVVALGTLVIGGVVASDHGVRVQSPVVVATEEQVAQAPVESSPDAQAPEMSDPAPETQNFAPYESEGGIPYSGKEWVVDVAPGEIEVFTGGPMTISGVSLKGGETRGSVLILLPGAKVTRYTVTNVLPGSNWHGSYHPTLVDESVWRALANDRVTAMINSQDNCSLGLGCTTVDVLVIDSTGVVAQWTISK